MSKFTINKGMSNEFIITIKENAATTPLVLVEGLDTFVTKLYKMIDGSEVATLTTTIEDAANGKIKVAIDSGIVSTLSVERGDRADHYYTKPLYRLAIDCNTANGGKFVAKVDKVYVEW